MRYLREFLLLVAALGVLPGAAGDLLPTVVAQRVAMPLEYQVDGVVEARRQATISAEVAGKVEAVYFDVDDVVEQGEVVLRIRDLEYRARVEKARAALAEAKANSHEAQLRYDRSAGLLKQKLIAQSAFDEANAALQATRARLASAEAALAEALEQLAHTVVRAPYGGVVVQRHVEPGEYTRPGEPFMSGYAPGSLRVSANLPQSIIASLRASRQARVVLLEDDASIEVERIVIHPVANPQNHSFAVRLDLAPVNGRLYPGMLVKVVIGVGDTERLLIPRQALVTRSEINAVYVQDENKRLALRQVRPGNRYGERIEILAGLDEGEIVAVDPVSAGIELKRQVDEPQ